VKLGSLAARITKPNAVGKVFTSVVIVVGAPTKHLVSSRSYFCRDLPHQSQLRQSSPSPLPILEKQRFKTSSKGFEAVDHGFGLFLQALLSARLTLGPMNASRRFFKLQGLLGFLSFADRLCLCAGLCT
jgi:hypothetical protein